MHINLKEKLRNHEKEIFKSYFEQKVKRLEKILDPYNYDEDAVKLSLSVEHMEKHNTYLVTIQIEIPHMKFHHQEAKHNLNEVLDIVFDNITKQLRGYFKKRKEDHKNRIPAGKMEIPEDEF